MTLPLTAALAAACTTFMNFPLHTDLPSPAVEAAPARDASGISCITAGRLVVKPIGAPARARNFEPNATR